MLTGFGEYFGSNGILYRTEFTADDEGYRPKIIKNKERKKIKGVRMTRKRKTFKKLILK